MSIAVQGKEGGVGSDVTGWGRTGSGKWRREGDRGEGSGNRQISEQSDF